MHWICKPTLVGDALDARLQLFITSLLQLVLIDLAALVVAPLGGAVYQPKFAAHATIAIARGLLSPLLLQLKRWGDGVLLFSHWLFSCVLVGRIAF